MIQILAFNATKLNANLKKEFEKICNHQFSEFYGGAQLSRKLGVA